MKKELRKDATLSGGSLKTSLLKGLRHVAFTMAEILLSLTIIGVVAAITLPSLTGNINERTWNTQRKALYSRMSQTVALMPSINGYGKLSEDEDGNVVEDTAAETFLSAGLSKVLKINNICDSEHLQDCGLPSNFKALNGTTVSLPKTLNEYNTNFNADVWSNNKAIKTKSAAFETANGESVLTFYNPYCSSDKTIGIYHNKSVTPAMCANFVYDLNGKKGPNTFGKDVGFITIMYATDPMVVAPMPRSSFSSLYAEWADGAKICRAHGDEYKMPNIYELMAISFNKPLMDKFEAHNQTWSSTPSTVSPATSAINMSLSSVLWGNSKTVKASILCVKRY